MAAGGEAAEAADWALPLEVEVLESIYLEELRVVRGRGRWEPWEISITLHPATAQDRDSQYVRFTLVLSVPAQYPNKAPKIAVRNPRGLSDEQIQKISQTLRSIAEARLGTEVLYELIEKGKEILTDNNIPHGQCVICLYGFQEREAFTKTQCYHYFHSHCLARYAQHMEEEIFMQQEKREQHLAPSTRQEVGVQCPVCRETLVYDLCALKAAPPPQHPLEPYRPDAKTLQHQEELRLIFKRQQEKGGIIDPEAERNRYFISLQAPPAAADPDQAASASELPAIQALPGHPGLLVLARRKSNHRKGCKTASSGPHPSFIRSGPLLHLQCGFLHLALGWAGCRNSCWGNSESVFLNQVLEKILCNHP
ncbi:E3 ubiquitin-protein ligase RNF25 isoform X2 [Pogoniulus pusillus]|uniref:E3 ubiquitin-protein ligase RNF25 isoform X2 n=1 Tax=Pogoniulus pusillus TaxID=488313 RepID=UPI0030B965AA